MSFEYLNGPITPGSTFHIVSSIVVSPSTNDIFSGGEHTTDDVYYSFLSSKDKYINFDDVYNKPFYYKIKDDNTDIYFYPVYINSGVGREELQIQDGSIAFPLYYEYARQYPDDTNTIQQGTTVPPPNIVKPVDVLKYMEFYAFDSLSSSDDKGYYYPLTLDQPEGSYHTHMFKSYPDITFYMEEGGYHMADIPSEVDTYFYHPYADISNSKYTFTKEPNGGFSFQLNSAGSYLETTLYRRFIAVDNDMVTQSVNDQDRATFRLIPTDHNVNTDTIYAGIPYKIQYEGYDVDFKFMKRISQHTDFLSDFTVEHMDGVHPQQGKLGLSIEPDWKTFHALSSNNITFYFIPTEDTLFDVATSSSALYSGHKSIDFASLYISGKQLKIRGEYHTYKHGDTGPVNVYPREISHTTSLVHAIKGNHTQYCKSHEHCGKCHGVCKGDYRNYNCVEDSVSGTRSDHEYFTCDHERFHESSQHVKKSSTGHHSKTLIIMACVLALVFITGIVLYEERKTILQHFRKIKNGR